MQNNYKINIFIDKENNVYHAYCPELVGCHSQGDSYEEALDNIKEAVDLYLGTFTEQDAVNYFGKPVPEKKTISPVDSDIQLRLSASQAEGLLLKAGFAPVDSKDNHRIYLKENTRFVLPLHSTKVLTQTIIKNVLDLVEKR